MELSNTIVGPAATLSFSSLLAKVFLWMGVGLLVTAIISYLFAMTPELLALLVNASGMTALGYLVTFSPIAFVLLMSFGFERFSYLTLLGLFLFYAAIMGASLSFIFLAYTSESIFGIFMIAALMFGGMGFVGYSTKIDLTKIGSILVMALVGLIIASLVNIFMHSSLVSYVISYISVVVFCGLTAWDIQKLKSLNENSAIDAETKSKLGILGALTLYLDFINLFLALLRIFGNRRNN